MGVWVGVGGLWVVDHPLDLPSRPHSPAKFFNLVAQRIHAEPEQCPTHTLRVRNANLTTTHSTTATMASSAPVSPPAIGHEEGKDTTTTSTSSQAKLPEFVEATMPPGVAIRPNAYGLGLFATHAFGKGDTLYITSCLYVPDVLGKLKLRLTDSGEEFELDMKEHSVLQSDTGMRQV